MALPTATAAPEAPAISDLDAPPRARTRPTTIEPTLILLVLLSGLGVLCYGAFLLLPEHRGHPLPYAIVIIAETMLVAQALLVMWTVLSAGREPRSFRVNAAREALFGDSGEDRIPHLHGRRVEVDVFITVYGEPLDVIERTALSALAMDGAHITWILDDGRSDAVRALAARIGARYVRRLSSNGAKAGNVNHALSISRGEYFVIFDADFAPKPAFLTETLPFFADDDVAFVQTPQVYGNRRNFISRGAGYMQSLFYRYILPGRNHFNAAFCVGTNVAFRRDAIMDVGGMYTGSKSEDVWTSLHLHEQGWRSVFIPVELAVGDAPDTIEAYTKQQLRWATGAFEILLTHNPLSPRRRLSPDQRIQYLATAAHYLVNTAPLLLIIVPPLEIFFDLRPVSLAVSADTWLLFYLGFYGMQVLLAFTAMGSFRLETLLLAMCSFPIYVAALWNVLRGREQQWKATGNRSVAASPFDFMVPQLLLFAFLALTSAVALYKDISHETFALATAWNITNTLILSVYIVVGLREAGAQRTVRRSRRAERRLRRRSGTGHASPATRRPSPPAVPDPAGVLAGAAVARRELAS